MANFEVIYIKVDPTNLSVDGKFKDIHISNRNVMNMERIRGIKILSISANFKNEKKFDKVVEIVTNYSNNYVWSSNGQSRERRPIPLCTLHLKQESGKKFFNWTNPLSENWIPVSNADDVLNLWCKDVFMGKVLTANIELSLVLCIKICK